MRLWNILRARGKSVAFRSSREADLNEELQFHLARETERLTASGMSADAARRQAMKTFGAVEATKDDCRDARGTMLVDNVLRDVRYALRSFLRAPLAALTIVMTVALGLGLITVVFTVLNGYVFRVDAVRAPEELFAVERQGTPSEQPQRFTREQYDAFGRETDIFAETFATTSDVSAWIDGRRREGRLVTGNFFRLLGVSAWRGRTLTPADDGPGGAPAIVLSYRAWTQHFAADAGILDRTILLNGAQFHVVGITPERFRGLEPIAAPDFWAPLALADEFRRSERERERGGSLRIVGRLKPGVARSQAQAQLLVWDANQPREGAGERPLGRLVLQATPGTVPLSTDVMLAFMPLFFAFGLILVIGCANVANLLLARAVARQREIGIRLALGASRRRVVSQLFTESLLLALVSAAVAFGLSRLVLIGIVYVVTTTFPPDIGNLRIAVPAADWRVGVFLVAGALLSTVFFALAPALQATRVELVRAMRGEVVRDSRPGRARSWLVALQVTGSVVLLITAAIFLRSSWTAASADPGLRIEGVLNVRVLDEQKRGALLDLASREPLVDLRAAAWPGWLGGLRATVEAAGRKRAMMAQFVSPEYFDVLDINLARGRGFTPAERTTNTLVAIVSESVARELWPGQDPLGQAVRVEQDSSLVMGAEAPAATSPENPLKVPRTVTVVGVAKDVAGIRLAGMRLGGAGIYMPTSAEAPGATLTMTVRGSTERARQALVDRFAVIDPNMAEVSTLRIFAQTETYLLGVPFWLTLVLGTLALLLTLSGLFSVLSYLVEQRTKEIGVRMALGATRGRIGSLVMSQSARPVVIGLLVGAGLTSAVGALLLASPAAEAIGSTVRLFDPVAYIASLLSIVAACAAATLVPALRAGRIHPVTALRHD